MGGIVSSAAGWRPAGVILVSTRFATGDSDRELLAAPGSLSRTGFPRPSSGGPSCNDKKSPRPLRQFISMIFATFELIGWVERIAVGLNRQA